MDEVDAIVIGAGVVGLASAAELGRRGLSVAVLEAASAFGTGISSRNSEVIHAGIYYPKDSLKATCCVQGRELLYPYLERHGIAHQRCGKLIVAASESKHDALATIAQRANENGVDDLQWLDAGQALALEPELACTAALLSPSTGIIDSHGLMLSLLGEVESAGGFLACRAPVESIRQTGHGLLELQIGGASATRLYSARVLNSAGLGAISLAGATEGIDRKSIPVQYYSKGSYFALAQGRAPFTRLIYPMPEDAWLGVHLTLDLASQARFGPDAQWTDGIDYQVDPSRADSFYDAIRRYWPGLPDHALVPAYAGMRPKIHGPEQNAPDFMLQDQTVHGVPGLVNLFGIESPGLTASLALAHRVADALQT